MAYYKSVLPNQQAERDFPSRVDVLIPPDGLGKHLDDMFEWLGAGGLRIPVYTSHGFQEWRGTGEAPRHFLRFYFYDMKDAQGFVDHFQELGAELSERDPPRETLCLPFGGRPGNPPS